MLCLRIFGQEAGEVRGSARQDPLRTLVGRRFATGRIREVKTTETFLTEWANNRILFDAGGNARYWTRRGIEGLAGALREGNSMVPLELYQGKQIGWGDVKEHTNWRKMMAVRDYLKAFGVLSQVTPRWLGMHRSIRRMWASLAHEAVERGIAIDGFKEVVTNEKSIDQGPAQIWEIKA